MSWSLLHTDKITSSLEATVCDLTIGFPSIAWSFLQSVYGWSALQYQAWARGKIIVEARTQQKVVLYTDHILEFWIDDRPFYGGDFYAFRNAPLVLKLSPGEHQIGK